MNLTGCITVVATDQFDYQRTFQPIPRHCPSQYSAPADFCSLASIWISVQKDYTSIYIYISKLFATSVDMNFLKAKDISCSFYFFIPFILKSSTICLNLYYSLLDFINIKKRGLKKKRLEGRLD